MSTTVSVNVTKGQKVDLTKGNPGLKTLKVGLGWDVNKGSGSDFDLDGFVFGLNDQNKIPNSDSICYYGKLSIYNGAVSHSGDNLTGVGDGDDETITVKLPDVPADIHKLIIAVNIYQASSRSQNFGMVRNAFVRCYDGDTNTELMKYDLGEDYSTFEGVVFGELYRNNGEWKFGAVSNGFNGDINSAAAMY
jgi:tellurium resistance protein TerD